MLFNSTDFVISPIEEIAAYETLWEQKETSFRSIAKLFENSPGSKPTDFIERKAYSENLATLIQIFDTLRADHDYRPNMLMNGVFNYPDKLRSAREPVELLYYTGRLDLIYTRSVAIVGSRRPSADGIRRAKKMAKLLVEKGFTIVSGLAAGIDTAAHSSAIDSGGNTIGVIGTPLDTVYPQENDDLQKYIAQHHLLVSQVPFIKYRSQDYRFNRLFFPERNKTMSAISEATIIIEASNTSGTLIQARAALQQGRKLFILNSCFENKSITWPAYYEQRGAIRVRDIEDVLTKIGRAHV